MLVGYMRVSTDGDRQVLDLLGACEPHRRYVNLTGDYVWDVQQRVSENSGGLRALRAAPELVRKAA
jgi:hypothetical protein